MADLIREINLPLEVDFISVSSYGVSTVSSGEVRITKDLDRSVEGKSVLLVEDIVDTGLTLNYLEEIFKKRNPANVKICCLLDKPSRRRSPVLLDQQTIYSISTMAAQGIKHFFSMALHLIRPRI